MHCCCSLYWSGRITTFHFIFFTNLIKQLESDWIKTNRFFVVNNWFVMGGTLWYLIMSEKCTWSTVWRSNPASKFKPHSGLSCSCSIYRCLDRFVTAHVPSTLPLLDHCATIMIPLLTMHMCQVYLFMFVEHHRSFSASTAAAQH
jgi:hypothetical protein